MQQISIGFTAGLLRFLLLCRSLLPPTKEPLPSLSPHLERFNCKMSSFENNNNKKNHCVWVKRSIDCPRVPAPRLSAAFCQHEEWAERSQWGDEYPKWKEKELSREKGCAPSLPLPQLLLNKWPFDPMLTFPVYSKQRFPKTRYW